MELSLLLQIVDVNPRYKGSAVRFPASTRRMSRPMSEYSRFVPGSSFARAAVAAGLVSRLHGGAGRSRGTTARPPIELPAAALRREL
jgi:hypothetical protein